MTFGQPRIGNAAFATYYSKLVPHTIRVTNEHDIVAHLPPYYSHFPQKTYHHFPREVCMLLLMEVMITCRLTISLLYVICFQTYFFILGVALQHWIGKSCL